MSSSISPTCSAQLQSYLTIMLSFFEVRHSPHKCCHLGQYEAQARPEVSEKQIEEPWQSGFRLIIIATKDWNLFNSLGGAVHTLVSLVQDQVDGLVKALQHKVPLKK